MVEAMDKRAFENLISEYDCYIVVSKKHQVVKTKDGDNVVAYIAMRHPEKIYLAWAVKKFWDGARRLNVVAGNRS